MLQNSAELPLVLVKGSRVLAAHPYLEIPKVTPLRVCKTWAHTLCNCTAHFSIIWAVKTSCRWSNMSLFLYCLISDVVVLGHLAGTTFCHKTWNMTEVKNYPCFLYFLITHLKLRERLISLNRSNQRNLDVIETSLFSLVLDETSPATDLEVSVKKLFYCQLGLWLLLTSKEMNDSTMYIKTVHECWCLADLFL